MSRRNSVIDFSFPENRPDGERAMPLEPEPPEQPVSPWRADLLILLTAALAALGTFLYEAWTRTHPETML